MTAVIESDYVITCLC